MKPVCCRSSVARLCLLLLALPLAAQADIRFASSSSSVLESSGSVTFEIVRTGDAATPASARVLVTHGSATAGDDYAGGETVLTWGAGDSSPKSSTVSIVLDGDVEGDETVHFALTDVSGDVRGTPDTFTLTIRNSNLQTADNPELTDQQKGVGETVDNLCPVDPPPGTELPAACSSLEGLTDDEQQQALDDVLPKHVAQQSSDVTLAQSGATRAVGSRMQAVRGGGASGGGGGGGIQNDLTLRSGSHFLPLALLGAGTSATDLVAEDSGALFTEGRLLSAVPVGVLSQPVVGGSAGGELLDERWGVFVTGQLSMADQDSTDDRIGYLSDGQQVTFGADYRFGTDVFAGAALSYSASSADLNADAGSQDGTVLLLMGYMSTYLTDSLYLDGYVSAGSASYDTERVVRLGTETTTITSSSDGRPLGLGVSAGMDFSDGAWSWGGYGRVDINKLTIDAYDEEGGDGLALAIDAQETSLTSLTFGGRTAYVIPTARGVIMPSLTAEWVHDLDDGNNEVTASFVEDPSAGSFSYFTGVQDQDYFNIGWSVAGTFTEGRSAFVRYEAQVGRSDYIAEQFEVGGRISF
jgi:uncharacterized protein YhjY with autotransporter beta-barrel domain